MRFCILLTFLAACGFDRLPARGATKLVFVAPPGDQVAGAAFAPVVQVAFEDDGGHVVHSPSTITIDIKGNPASGTLSGTKTIAAVDGVATFSDLSIDRLGAGYTLQASAGGVPSETSIEFAVAAGPPSKLVFIDEPQSAVAGLPITAAGGGLRVALQDASGNTIPTATDLVTAAIGVQAGPGTLSGTLTVAATAGIATFADLDIDRTGIGYTLAASSASYASASSEAFDISPAAADPDISTVLGSPSSVTADNVATSTITVTVLDSFGNGIPGKTVTLSATGTANTLSQPAITDGTGIATGTIASTKAEIKTITANVDALDLTAKPAVTFVAGAAANLAMVSGDGQGGSPGATLAPFVVAVTDAYGNAVSSAAVTFGVSVGNGTLSTMNVMTDAAGLAPAALTLGTSGTDIVVAQSTGLAGSPVVFGAVSTALSTRGDVASATRPYGVTLGDLNGDGKRDVALANNGANTVSVLINTTAPGATSASFATRADFATGVNPNGVATGDLNGDGKPDLVVTNQVSATISVLFNTTAAGSTTPSFAAKVDFVTAGNPASPVLGDINGDGRLDVAAACSTGFVSVLFNTTAVGSTTPSFSTKTDLLAGTAPFGVAIGDLNGDGKLDLAAANATSSTLSLFLNTTAPGASTPTFTPKTNFATASGPFGVAIGDVSGDGKPDLVVANQNATSVSVFLNTTTPGASTPTLAPKADFATETSPRTVALGDVNGDGRLDVVVTNFTSNTISLLLDTTPPGAATPRFASQVAYATATGTYGVAVGNLNGDGTSDVVATSSGSNALSVFLDTTVFGRPLAFGTGVTFATGARPQAVASGELNGDGKPDVVVANYNSNNVSVLLSTTAPGGAPAFAAAVNLAVDTQPFSIALADLNGDGLLDLATANQVGTVSVSLNQTSPGASTPSFSAVTNLTAGNTPTSVAIDDINGDGKPDLAVANQNANTLSVFLNTTAPGATTPTFATKVDFTTGTRPFSIVFADVNGNGVRDLVVGNFGDSTFSILLGTTTPGATTPTFAAKVDFTGGGYAVAIGDFNGDGKPDVASVDRIFGKLSILFDTTTGGATTPTFTTKADFALGTAPTSIALADFDQDGRLDCTTSGFAAPGNASVLLNTTSPGATTPSLASKADFASAQPVAVVGRDVNGDGKPDLVLANMNNDTVSVLLGK